jgi:hypothetical protein
MLRYIELKSGYNDNGPAWLGRVKVSQSGQTIYFNGKAFKRSGRPGTYIDLETREEYWISGVKKRGTNRHWAGSGRITIEAGAVTEYLELVGETELDRSLFIISNSIAEPDPGKFHKLENEAFNPR